MMMCISRKIMRKTSKKTIVVDIHIVDIHLIMTLGYKYIFFLLLIHI